MDTPEQCPQLLLKFQNIVSRGIFAETNHYIYYEKIMGFPVLGTIQGLIELGPDFCKSVVVAISDNHERERTYSLLGKFGFTFPSILAPTCFIDRSADIGAGVLSVITPSYVRKQSLVRVVL